MKTFKIKDLVVSLDVNPNADLRGLCGIHTPSIFCPGNSVFCTFISHYCFTHTCHAFSCGGCSIQYCSHLPSLIPVDFTIWKTTSPVQTVVDNLQDSELAEFKVQLAELNKYVDQKIQEVPGRLDELEKKLSEAIEEVRAQKGQTK